MPRAAAGGFGGAGAPSEAAGGSGGAGGAAGGLSCSHVLPEFPHAQGVAEGGRPPLREHMAEDVVAVGWAVGPSVVSSRAALADSETFRPDSSPDWPVFHVFVPIISSLMSLLFVFWFSGALFLSPCASSACLLPFLPYFSVFIFLSILPILVSTFFSRQWFSLCFFSVYVPCSWLFCEVVFGAVVIVSPFQRACSLKPQMYRKQDQERMTNIANENYPLRLFAFVVYLSNHLSNPAPSQPLQPHLLIQHCPHTSLPPPTSPTTKTARFPTSIRPTPDYPHLNFSPNCLVLPSSLTTFTLTIRRMK